jgi:hypothetical protein
VNQPVWTEETFALVREGVRLANEAYTSELPEEWDRIVEARARDLGSPHAELEPGNLNVVIFHVKIPAGAEKVKAPDIRNIDHDSVDYETLIRLNIWVALKTNPRSRVFLLTDQNFLGEMKQSRRLNISRISLNSSEPMFERVLTMAAYVRSKLFDQPTIFLDSDAFLLRPAQNLFANRFDVAFTHRSIIGQMPINEGVIFANNFSIQNTRSIFNAYIASYLSIENQSEISKIYTNIRRWRGGQLAINALAHGGQIYISALAQKDIGRIVTLPCSVYNLSQIAEHEVSAFLLSRSLILHLKGNRKAWVDRITSMVSG